MAINFDGQVAIITGAGAGLGKDYALLFASRGAKVVVNDLGKIKETGEWSADLVVAEIIAAGGVAVADHHSVTDGADVVKTATDAFGTVDIIVNNAGILRDIGFHRMTKQQFDLIMQVHVYGPKDLIQAAWPMMREKKYGRIVNVTSSNGIKGERGQVNYSCAKSGIIGMSKALAKEGKKYNIKVNCIAPGAGSAMTATVMPEAMVALWKPEFVSPVVAILAHESVPCTGRVIEAGGGWFGETRWHRSKGVYMNIDEPYTPEDVMAKWAGIVDFEGADDPDNEMEHGSPPMLKQILAKM